MTAVSAYAPTRRNRFLTRYSKQSFFSRRLRQTTYVAILLVVLKFWSRRPEWIRRVREALHLDDDGSSVIKQRGTSMWNLISKALESILKRLQLTEEPTLTEESSRSVMLNGTGTAAHGLRKSGDLSRIRENHRRIQGILNYWFGQYPPDVSQKKLWMIAASSTEYRKNIDGEIAERFQDTITELSLEESSLWHEWCHDTELYGYQGKVAAIVALDQFSRHVTRRYEETSSSSLSPLPPQATLDARAYQTAQLFVQYHNHEIDTGMVPTLMYVFSLMPYRHANTMESVKYVQECIDKMSYLEQQMDSMVGRFRKATNRRMAVLQDSARRMGSANNGIKSLCDFSDEDILETVSFDADMTDAHKHIVHKTIVSFLNSRGIQPDTPAPIIVSLSGGVDSMVVASVLSFLNKECKYHMHIVAVHIDYANRPESSVEADYVMRYCERLGILYKCRRIDEVTRGVTARDDYERIARDVRYTTYRQTVQECNTGGREVGVMLGHHRGDLRENVLSNSHKGCGPLDLSGMTAVSVNDGVTIYRPLLPLEKKEIYDYAHKFGVPYFKDTTPHWSTRGKLRNKLIPLLQEIYGEGSMDNLSNLAVESDEARELLHKSVLAPFLKQVERKPMGITFATEPWKEQGLFFWKFVLREALHSAGLGMFSDKSVLAFLERIQASQIRSGWLQCRRDYAVYLEQEDGRVFVFFPESFPFRKADEYDCAGKAVLFGSENAVSVGPWIVYSEVVSPSEQDTALEDLLEQKAMSSMESLFDGYVSYYLETELDDTPRPLVFISEYSKKSRPRAWKNTDLKVQSILPLLGKDETTMGALADVSTRRSLVRVTLVLGTEHDRFRS